MSHSAKFIMRYFVLLLLLMVIDAVFHWLFGWDLDNLDSHKFMALVLSIAFEFEELHK